MPPDTDVDPTPKTDAPKAEPPPVDPVSDKQQTFDAEYVGKLRAEAAKYRTDAKELAQKAKQFDDLQESQKSELQKANERADQAQRDLESARLETLRARVAVSKKLPASIADRLRGTTQEEMEADADVVLSEIEKQYVAKQGASRSATGAGVAGKAPDLESMTPAQLVEAIKQRNPGGVIRGRSRS